MRVRALYQPSQRPERRATAFKPPPGSANFIDNPAYKKPLRHNGSANYANYANLIMSYKTVTHSGPSQEPCGYKQKNAA